MRIKNSLTLSKSSPLFAILIAMFMANTSINEANAFTADEVLNKMNADQRIFYVNGIASGLAYARWLKDKPDQSGMQCINKWYYQSGADTWKRITAFMELHLDKPVPALVHVLAKKECGS